jgi:hypothetical protein
MGWRERLNSILGAGPGLDAYEVSRMYAGTGLAGVPMPRTNPSSEQDAARMGAHFGADLAQVRPDWLGVVRDAERVCACCETVERCHAWFASGRDKDSPRLFCPNAETFDQLAAAQDRDGD